MDAWMTLLAALGPALAKALYEVGKEVVVKPLMGPAAEQFKAWVRCDYDARVDDARVRGVVEAAVKATGRLDREGESRAVVARFRGGRPRTLRGGSWNDNQRNARVSERNRNNPDNSNNNCGFRVVAYPASSGF